MADIYPGEKGFKIEITIKDSAGVAFNLTGATVVYKIQNPKDATESLTATIDNAASGITSFVTVDENKFTAVGKYKVQPKVTTSTGNVFYGTTQEFTITDRELHWLTEKPLPWTSTQQMVY
jgi:hypothetical protein